jgi:hypothetical protein
MEIGRFDFNFSLGFIRIFTLCIKSWEKWPFEVAAPLHAAKIVC